MGGKKKVSRNVFKWINFKGFELIPFELQSQSFGPATLCFSTSLPHPCCFASHLNRSPVSIFFLMIEFSIGRSALMGCACGWRPHLLSTAGTRSHRATFLTAVCQSASRSSQMGREGCSFPHTYSLQWPAVSGPSIAVSKGSRLCLQTST